MSLLIGSAGQKFLIWLFYEKSISVVVDFELKKFSLGNLMKSFFQSSLGLILLTGGWQKSASLLIGSARQKFLIWLFYEKSTSVNVYFEVKKFSLGNLTKSFFQSGLGLILLNWGLAEECVPAKRFCRTKIFDLVVLRKKYVGGC